MRNLTLKVSNKRTYSDARKKEYPSLEDQFDALWKGGQYEAQMRLRILSIKDKFPKPEDK